MDKFQLPPEYDTDELQKFVEMFPQFWRESYFDFDEFKAYISGIVPDDLQEKYSFTWHGKTESYRLLKKNSHGTLRPCKEDSVNWATTQNLYLEGDNLEVLKLIKHTYAGENGVKMIYIDPPYNSNEDFIYDDNFMDSLDKYLEYTGQKGIAMPEASGRYHTRWLNMMYPRLWLANYLLRDDGIIFISIDDREVTNLRKLCDEVFGEENFINIITVKTKIGGVSGSSEGKSLRDATEFILAYAKNKSSLLFNPVYIKTKLFDRIKSYKEQGKSWKYTSIVKTLADKELIKVDKEKGMKFYGYKILETASIFAFANEKEISVEEVYNQYADRIFQTTNAQSSVRQTVMNETNGLDYPMIGCEYIPIKGKNEGKTIEILYKGEQRRMMMYLSDAVEKVDDIYYYLDKVDTLWDDIEYNNLTKEGEMEYPNGKKPIRLMQKLINLSCDNNDLVMDFFSGSASTAHAVMQNNIENDKQCRFIMVQLPEPIDKSDFENICEIGKERIRRAGAKVLEEWRSKQAQIKIGEEARQTPPDIGFRVFKLDKSNFKVWDDSPIERSEIEQLHEQLELFADSPFVHGRSHEDIVYEIIRMNNYPLTTPIIPIEINQKTVYGVGEDCDFIICLDVPIDEPEAEELCKYRPGRILFTDKCFENTEIRINVEHTIRNINKNIKLRVV